MIRISYLSVFVFCIATNLSTASDSLLNHAKAKDLIQSQPVNFIKNNGQMVDENGKSLLNVLYKVSSPSMDVYITTTGLTYIMHQQKYPVKTKAPALTSVSENYKETATTNWDMIEMKLSDASIKKENIIEEGSSIDFSQFFLSHCPQGISNVHSFKKITIQEVYPGIDWIIYNSSRTGFKYDFIVHPNADPNKIALIYNSKKPIVLEKDGSWAIETTIGNLKEEAPFTHQENNKIKSNFKLSAVVKNQFDGYYSTIIFETGTYNKSKDLVIDPQLVWCTLFGGNLDDCIRAITTDLSGNLFIVGITLSNVFPLLNPGGGAYYSGTYVNNFDSFIAKFNSNGTLIWSTFYGGIDGDYFESVCTDNSGNVFVTGYTYSSNFPVFNPGGSTYFQNPIPVGVGMPIGDIIVLKFSNTAQRLWATAFAGTGTDLGYKISADATGNIFVVGQTTSTDITLLNPGGSSFFQSIITGTNADLIIVKFNNSGILLWSTLYGGNSFESSRAMCLDASGNIFITGTTYSPTFPILNPGGGTYFQGTYSGGTTGSGIGGDAFILKFSNSGTCMWATYYGGSQSDGANDIKTDNTGDVVVVGGTASTNFPLYNTGAGAYFQSIIGGGSGDGFILKFNNNGIRKWSSYYGGNGSEALGNLCIDKCNNIYAIGGVQNASNLTMIPDCNGGYYDNVMGPFNIFKSILIHFSHTNALNWSTYTGGLGIGNIDIYGNLYLAGGPSATTPYVNLLAGAYFDVSQANGDGLISKFILRPTNSSSISSSAAGCSCFGSGALNSTSLCSSVQYEWYNSTSTLIASNSSINGLCPGNYTGIVIDTLACYSDTLTTTISSSTIFPLVNILTAPCGTINNGSVSALVTGGIPPYSYNWLPTGGTNPVATNLVSGTYSVIVTDTSGCIDTASIVLGSLPVPNSSINGTDTICQGESITLSAGGGGSYSWSTGDTTENIIVNPTTTANYFVVVSNGNCNDTSSLNITVNTLPIVTISSDVTILLGDSVQLYSNSSGIYNWSPSTELSCTNCQNPFASPTETTTYCISVTNNYGCTSDACVEITVQIPSSLFVPNAFTPNGNSLNDIFKPILVGAHDYHLLIFNRWGENIFESRNIEDGWNGYFKQQLCQQDVYVYKITYNDDINKKFHQMMGHVTLVK